MSLEAPRPQPQPLETAQPTTSPRMEQVVTQLAATHNIDLSQKGAAFILDVPDQKQQWMIGNIDGQRVGVTRCAVDEAKQLSPELDMVFNVGPEGWEPVEVVHTEHAWQDYAYNMPKDTQGDFNFATLADTVAQDLAQKAPIAEATTGLVFDGNQEDAQQNFLGKNPLPIDQNLPPSATGELALTSEDIYLANTEQRVESLQIEQLVKKLAEAHGVDLSQPGAFLVLDRPSESMHPDFWEIRNVRGELIWITGYIPERLDGFPRLRNELDIILAIDEAGWKPDTLIYSEQVYSDFMQAMEAQGRIVRDPETEEFIKDVYVDGQFPDDLFIAYWAQRIEQDGWLERGRKLDRLPPFKMRDDEN